MVWVRWWTKKPGRLPQIGGWPGALVAAALGVITFGRWVRGGPQGTWAAVWLPSSPSGTVADLVVKLDPEAAPTSDGEDRAVLLSEAAPNGALALEIRGQRIFPVFNPLAPVGLLRRVAGTRP